MPAPSHTECMVRGVSREAVVPMLHPGRGPAHTSPVASPGGRPPCPLLATSPSMAQSPCVHSGPEPRVNITPRRSGATVVPSPLPQDVISMTGHATQDRPLFRSVRRGKARLSTRLTVSYRTYSLKIGCHCYGEQQSGMAGVSEKHSFNLQATCVAVPCRNGTFWPLVRSSPCRRQLLYCVAGLIQVAKHWLPKTFAMQHSRKESLSDFIRRLEQLFKLAYGQDGMGEETRGTLLHSQLQEGLCYKIMKAPAVSGSHGYKELCLASRNEEKWLAELAKQ